MIFVLKPPDIYHRSGKSVWVHSSRQKMSSEQLKNTTIMNAVRKIEFVTLMMLFVGCAPSVNVYTDYDRDVNVRSKSTYSWMNVKDIELKNNPLYYNELTDKRIKEAVDLQMKSRGYEQKDTGGELILHYHIVIQDKTVVRTDPYGYYYGPYWTRSRVDVFPYREGSLIIDLMDAESNNLAWRGWAVRALNGQAISPEEREIIINSVVEKIFEKYPYRVN